MLRKKAKTELYNLANDAEGFSAQLAPKPYCTYIEFADPVPLKVEGESGNNPDNYPEKLFIK